MNNNTNIPTFKPALELSANSSIIPESQQQPQTAYLKKLFTDVADHLFHPLPSSWDDWHKQNITYTYTKHAVLPRYEIKEPQLNDTHQSRPQDWVIERFFGGRHWCNRWVSELCASDPAFLTHLSEQREGYIHYLCLVRLAWRKKQVQLSIAEQALVLRQSTQKSLLHSLYHPCPEGLLKTLTKLGHIPLSRKYYQLLIALLGKVETRAYLAHSSRVRAYHLRWLNDFPTDLLQISVLRSIKNASDYRMLQSIEAVLRVLQKDPKHASKFDAVKRLKTLSQLENWIQRFVLTLTFPPAPWSGNNEIQPITTAKALKATAHMFSNCIYGYVRSVLLGYRYLYICERGPVVIALKRDPLLNWHIEEINGVNNTKPDDNIVDDIERAFSEAHFSTRLDNSLDALWDVIDDHLY